MKVAAIVVAAGQGTRLGSSLPKAFVSLAGRPLLAHTLEALAQVPEITALQPVLNEEGIPLFAELVDLLSLGKTALLSPVVGGAERQDSVRAGLEALPASVEIVLVHDAARPFVPPQAVSQAISVAGQVGGALLAIPLRDTIKQVEAGQVVATPARGNWVAAQTPQVFQRELLARAMEQAERDQFLGTDDAQLVERVGGTVRVVEGSPENRKITVPLDLEFAEYQLRVRNGDEG